MSKTTIALPSDLHTNSTVGLCPPYVELHDGGSYRASAAQRYLWRHWLDSIERIKELAAGGRLVVCFNGDIYDGDHHNTAQIVTRGISTMHRIAHEVTAPLIDVADEVLVTFGTAAHVGGAHHLERDFAADVDADARHYWQLDVDGVRFDIAHHGKMGRLPWSYNAGQKLAAILMIEYAERGERLPDIIVRSHQHRWSDSHDQFARVRGIFTGCWQLPTDYIRAIQPGALAQIGTLVVVVEDGAYTVHKLRYKPWRDKVVRV